MIHPRIHYVSMSIMNPSIDPVSSRYPSPVSCLDYASICDQPSFCWARHLRSGAQAHLQQRSRTNLGIWAVLARHGSVWAENRCIRTQIALRTSFPKIRPRFWLNFYPWGGCSLSSMYGITKLQINRLKQPCFQYLNILEASIHHG